MTPTKSGPEDITSVVSFLVGADRGRVNAQVARPRRLRVALTADYAASAGTRPILETSTVANGHDPHLTGCTTFRSE